MKECGEYEALISAAVDGAVSEAERRELMGHLAQCAACREKYEQMMALHEAFAAWEAEEPPADLTAGREAAQVPGHVFPDVAAGVLFAAVVGEESGVPHDDPADLAEGRLGGDRLAPKVGGEFGEQPGAAQAAAADDHTVAAGAVHHRRGVRGLEDVAVAEDGDAGAGHVLDEPADLVPVRVAGVALGEIGRASCRERV